ncbi:MAG: hypothetical protein U0703_16765 [Anaerolineae bacterium]
MLPVLQSIRDERIVITGYLGAAERLEALAAADVFCDGRGLVDGGAGSAGGGLAGDLSPGCNLPEAAEAGAGLIVEPQVEPLAAALRDVLSDAEQRATMGTAARSLARERFTWSRSARGWKTCIGKS